MRLEARRRLNTERRTRERRRRDVPVAIDRRWLPQRRRGARRGGLVERLHRYSN